MTSNRPRRSSVIFTVIVVCASVATFTHADPGPMQIVYQQDFQGACAGWCPEAFARGDRAGVEPDPFPSATKSAPANLVIGGHAMDPRSPHGYRIESPPFEQMGVDTTMPYQISFRYAVPETPSCWTYAIASTHVSLVLTECDTEAGTATLAFVDELAQKVEVVGTIQLGGWNDVELRVIPRNDGSARVRVRLNGVVQGIFVRTIPSEFDGIVFMDLPYRYTDATDGEFDRSPSAFGSGDWDDVVLRRVPGADDTGPRVQPHVDPDSEGGGTVLGFTLPRPADVRVEVFAVNGRRVRTLYDGRMTAGPQALAWDGRDAAHSAVASGVYLVRTIIDGTPTVLRTTVVR